MTIARGWVWGSRGRRTPTRSAGVAPNRVLGTRAIRKIKPADAPDPRGRRSVSVVRGAALRQHRADHEPQTAHYFLQAAAMSKP